MGSKSKSGGSQSKFGRGARSPSAKHYRAAGRADINKVKRIKRDLRIKAKAAIKKITRLPAYLRDVHADKLQEMRHVVSQNRTG